MRPRRKTDRTFSFVVVAALLLSAGSARSSSLAEVRERGRLIMLCVPHQENHFVHTRLETGPMRRSGTTEHFAGADVDLMAAFARHLGVELEVRPAFSPEGMPTYTALLAAVEEGKGDLAASSLSITEERLERVDFSRPYFVTEVVVVMRRGDTVGTMEDLRGRRASAIPGSSQEGHLERLGFGGGGLRAADFMLENYRMVAEGEVDFTLVDAGSAEAVLPDFPSLERAFSLPIGDRYGIAVQKGSDLLPVLDRFLERMERSGELEAILAAHLPEKAAPE